MPRAKKHTKPPKELKQKTLTGFVTLSSPIAASSSPTRASTSKLTRTPDIFKSKAKRKYSSPSDIPTDNDEDSGSDVGAIHFEPETIVLSDEDASPRRPRAKKRKTRLRRSSSADAENVPRSDEEQFCEEEVGMSVRWTGKRKAMKRHVNLSDDDEKPQPRRRKFVKGVRPPSSEDEDDILDEVDEDKIIDARLRTRNKKTAFQRNLDKLKRKKQGQPPLETSESEEQYDDIPFAGAKPHESNSESDDSRASHLEKSTAQEEDSFIVDDEAGAPATQLPIMFSMNTHQELIHHFKVICQLFVHLAVRPHAERHAFMQQTMKSEEYFSVPLQIARRKLSGIRDSLVVSSIWRPEFKKPLETYPELEVTSLDFAIPACDACHLGGRLSTRLGRLSGRPYDRLTYEPLDDPEESDAEDSNSDEDDGDSAREQKTAKEFNLGRFCAARTQVFHKFMHWEYTLYTSLARQVDEGRRNDGGYVRVAYAQGKQPPTDPTDADGFMDWLDQRGMIDIEWQYVKEMMEGARNLEMIAKRGEDGDMD